MNTMWNLLLDIIPYGSRRPRIPVGVKPTKPPVVDSTEIVTTPDSVAATQDLVVGGSGDDMTMLLMSIFVTLFALALCFYFIYTYRRYSLSQRA